MSIIRRIKRKNKQTGKDEVMDLGALGSNIVQDATHRFVTDEEKTAWNGKVDASGGDISSTKISTITDSSEPFPVPEEDDPTDTWVGKIKKWQQDCLAKFGNYLLTSMISNQHQNNTGTVPSSALAYLMQQAIVANQNSIGVLNTNKLDKTDIVSQYNKLRIRNITIQYGKMECMVNYYGQASLVFPEAYASEDLYHCLAIPMSGAYAVRSITNNGANNALALLMDNNGAHPDYQSMIWMQYIVIGMQTA